MGITGLYGKTIPLTGLTVELHDGREGIILRTSSRIAGGTFAAVNGHDPSRQSVIVLIFGSFDITRVSDGKYVIKEDAGDRVTEYSISRPESGHVGNIWDVNGQIYTVGGCHGHAIEYWDTEFIFKRSTRDIKNESTPESRIHNTKLYAMHLFQ